MNIVLIGPDGSGKTTLGKILAQMQGMEYVKCTFAEDDKMNRAKQLIGQSVNVLFDRFYYPDHLIYSQVKGDVLNVKEVGEWNELESLMLKKDFVLIYLSAPDDVLKYRISNRGDEYIATWDIGNIKKYYGAFLTSTDLPLLKLETDGFVKQKDMNKIQEFLEKATEYYKQRDKNYMLKWGVFTGETYSHCSSPRLV